MAKERFFKFVVKDNCQLFDFLSSKLNDFSRNKIKAFLKHEQISVNGIKQTQYNYLLSKDDVVEIDFNKQEIFFHPKIKILYEDDSIIVVDKASGIPTNPVMKDKDNSVFKVVLKYLRNKDHKNTLYYIHRLDKETSGALVFAKNSESQDYLKENWHSNDHKRIYYALVEGEVIPEKGTLTSWLKEDPKTQKMFSSNYDNGGQKAITKFQVEKRSKNKTLLKIELITGRKNQIRIQLVEFGHPVVGDMKYGNKNKSEKRLFLHAYNLTIRHPQTKKIMTFEVPLPNSFLKF